MRFLAFALTTQLAVCTGFVVPLSAQHQRQMTAEMDAAPPPSTLAEFVAASDAVVLASSMVDRNDHHQPAPAGPKLPITIHDIEIKEILKPHPELAGVGGVISVAEWAGTVEDQDFKVTSSEPVHIVPGGEYVLFLHWNPYLGKFELQNGPHGIYRVKRGTVEAAAQSDLGRTQQGREASAFMRDLKAAGAAKGHS